MTKKAISTNIFHRKSIRLPKYDYSQNGAYFITLCTQNKECLFGKIANETMLINNAGTMIKSEWLELPNRFDHVELSEYVVMPNHFHGIIILETPQNKSLNVGAPLVGAHQIIEAPTTHGQPQGSPLQSISNIIGAFKSITTHRYIQGVKKYQWPLFDKKLWQRNYYEHIIRNEESLNEIIDYIATNPMNWHKDSLFI